MSEDPFASFDLALAVPAQFMPPKAKKKAKVCIVALPANCQEVDVFALMLWKFERPNGMFSLLGQPGGDPDSPWKWDFSFRMPDGLLVAVIRTWRHLEFWFSGRRVSEANVLAFLRYNMDRYGNLAAIVRDGLEKHRLVINPYIRHRRMAEFAESELVLLEVPPIWYPKGTIVSEASQKRHVQSVRAHLQISQRETFFSVTLVSESAYMAEAYLNLLLAFTLKPVLRSDKHLMKDALHKQWRSKLQHLPLTSEVVSKVPDLGDPRVVAAQGLFELRNQIAHSYPDPEQLGVGHVYFQQSYPVLEQALPFDEFQLATQRRLPTREAALLAKKTADNFVAFVSEQVDGDFREQLEFASSMSPIGFNEQTGGYSVPFGGAVIKGFAGVKPGRKTPRRSARAAKVPGNAVKGRK